jgi:hypothetical protein
MSLFWSFLVDFTSVYYVQMALLFTVESRGSVLMF